MKLKKSKKRKNLQNSKKKLDQPPRNCKYTKNGYLANNHRNQKPVQRFFSMC